MSNTNTKTSADYVKVLFHSAPPPFQELRVTLEIFFLQEVKKTLNNLRAKEVG